MNLALILPIGSVGSTELIILLSIILLFFKVKKIPELAKGLGTGVREFRKGTSGEADREVARDRKEDKELPRSGAVRNEEVRPVKAGQKH